MDLSNCSTCLLKSKAARYLLDEELITQTQNCVHGEFKKGETIFKQNALSSNIIYIQTGLVKLMIDGPHATQILRLKKAPCYLGIPTTMGDKINHYSAIALESTQACFIDIGVFRGLLKTNPEFSYQIIVKLCKNELDQFDRCVNLVQKQIFGRLATHLLYLSNEIFNSKEFIMPLTRNEIAQLTSTSRETVSRLLNVLSKEKIIKINGKKVQVLNYQMLVKISEKG